MSIRVILERAKHFFAAWAMKPEWVYLVIAVSSVIGFVFITPPFQGPDEESHYIRAQYIAHGYFVPVDVNKTSASLPRSIEQVAHETFYGKDRDIRGNTAAKYDIHRTKNALHMPLNAAITYKPAMIAYGPLPYLPAIPGILFANLLNFSPLISMYVARLSLGAASIALIFFAIRFLPYKKYLFVAVGLIPMLLFQQAVITADSVSYALLAFFIAFVLYLRNKPLISRRQWIVLGLVCLAITLAKPLVFLFLPLIILLVKKQKAWQWIGAIALICLAFFAAWTLATSAKTDTGSVAGMPADVNSSQQLHEVIARPRHALRVLWNTYMTPYGDDEVRGVIGVFGAADTVYPLWMFSFYCIILGLLAVISFDKETEGAYVSRLWKWIAIVLSVAYFCLVNLALYLGYTPVNFEIVYGVQGRYFLPILIIFSAVVATGGTFISKSDQPKLKTKAVSMLVILTLLALFVTFQRYYLYTP